MDIFLFWDTDDFSERLLIPYYGYGDIFPIKYLTKYQIVLVDSLILHYLAGHLVLFT